MKAVNKIVMIAVMLSFFFAASSAVAESGIVTDPEDDVLKFSQDGETEEFEKSLTDEVPSADIIEVSYEREDNGTGITINLKVNDRGKIETMDLENLENEMDFIGSILPLAYSMMVNTNQSDYEIVFQDNMCILNYDEQVNFTIDDNEFSVMFDLNSANETIEEFGAQSFFIEFSLTSTTMFMDAAPDSFMFMAEIDAPLTASVGETIDFTGIGYNIADMMGLDFSDYEYEWDFDDGSTATGETVTHSFQLPGTYAVRLTASDSEGTETTATHTITISEASTPPNGDENGSDNEDEEDSPIIVFIAILAIIVAIGIIALIVVIRR